MKDENLQERVDKEIDVIRNGYRCGECARISYYREGERWECGGSYCSPSGQACFRFRLSEGAPVEGTFPDGAPPRVSRRLSDAYAALAENNRKKEKKKKETVFEHLMALFSEDMDLLIDYMMCTSCCDCEHENTCPHSYKGDLEGCRQYLRQWLNSPYEG